MPLPKAVDQLVRSALVAVVRECSEYVKSARQEDVRPPSQGGFAPGVVDYARDQQRASGKWPRVDREEFSKIQHDALAVFELIGAGRPPLAGSAQQIREMLPSMPAAEVMLGIVTSVYSSYERGLFEPLFAQLEAALAGDYLAQAEELLEEGQRGKSDHVPAAVLLGAVFEKRIRVLCAARMPPIDVRTSDGHPKKVVVLIDELKKAGQFSETKAKELRWIADIRNKAAHGDFDQFSRSDVEKVQTVVGQFLDEHR